MPLQTSRPLPSGIPQSASSITAILRNSCVCSQNVQRRFPKAKPAFHQTSSAVVSTTQTTACYWLALELRHLTSSGIWPFLGTRATQNSVSTPLSKCAELSVCDEHKNAHLVRALKE